MRHTISVLVENKFGVLARVAGMISGRGFNIDSLNVAPTHDPSLSRITLVLNGDESSLDLCTKQLRKLVNVVEIIDFKGETPVARELVLVKVRAEAKRRPEIFQIIETKGDSYRLSDAKARARSTRSPGSVAKTTASGAD